MESLKGILSNLTLEVFKIRRQFSGAFNGVAPISFNVLIDLPKYPNYVFLIKGIQGYEILEEALVGSIVRWVIR